MSVQHISYLAPVDTGLRITMRTLLCLLLISVLTRIGCAEDLKPLNIKFMLRGYCYAGSRPDKSALGGHGSSTNLPRRITTQPGKSGVVALVALPGETVPFARSYHGFRLLLINRTRSELAFSASDSRLPIVQEALDPNGKWRPIEYLPESSCGNSYHRVFLPPQRFWEFAAPTYTGKQRTRLRFVLQHQPPIYSNEFDGSINPAQFTKKQGHKPSSIMDPYNE